MMKHERATALLTNSSARWQKYCLSLLVSFLVSTPLTAQEDPDAETPAPPAEPSRDLALVQMTMLANSLPADQVVWLKEADKEFLGVQTLARTAAPHGWIVILHDTGQHPRWPGALTDMQDYLPNKGWHTLAITLPPAYHSEPLPRPSDTPSDPATDGTAIEPTVGANERNEIFDEASASISDGTIIPDAKPAAPADTESYERQAVERIVAAINYLATQNADGIVLFGEGLGATRAAEYLVEVGNSAGKIQALLMLNAQNHAPGKSFSVTAALTNPAFPILDLLSQGDVVTQRDATARREEAQRKGLNNYRQQSLVLPPYENMSRTVYGFLQTTVTR